MNIVYLFIDMSFSLRQTYKCLYWGILFLWNVIAEICNIVGYSGRTK